MDSWNAGWAPEAEGGEHYLAGELTTQPEGQPAPAARNAERVPMEMGAGLRQRGASGVSIQIMDLSTHGFRAATHLDLAAGADVWLRLPGLEPCHAKVMWSRGHLIGCAFERPLHSAVLQMVIGKSRNR